MEKPDLEKQPILGLSSPPRLIKDNKFRIKRHNVRGLLFVRDLFHTLLSMHPAAIFSILVVSYFLLAAAYAAYYLVVLRAVHESQINTYGKALIASLQIQSTIGFAAPGMDHWARNWLVIVGITLHSVCTVLFNIFLLGTLFARLSSARNRAISVRVSSVAVVGGKGESAPYLEFRVGEIRKHQLMNLRLSASLYFHKGNKMFSRENISLTPPDGIFLAVPTEIRHVVDETSPLWHFLCGQTDKTTSHECSVCGESFRNKVQLLKHMKYEGNTHEKALRDSAAIAGPSRASLRNRLSNCTAYWELVVMIEGTEPVTGSPIQVRHSYTMADLRFDTKFRPCWTLIDSGDRKRIVVDFEDFDKTE